MRTYKVLGMSMGMVLAAFGCAGGETLVQQTTSSSSSGGTGGEGGDTGAGGHMTSSSTSSSSGGCTSAADCASFGDACNMGACINSVCGKLPANEGSTCDDGIACTVNTTCQNGQCQGGTLKPCPSSNPCMVGVCDPATDSCIEMPGNNGSPCVDNDACTLTGTCSAGTCVPGGMVDCSFLDGPCSLGYCDPQTGCKIMPLAEGTVCPLGINDPCVGGSCTQGQCLPVPANEGGVCDDGKFCTIGDHCQNGICTAGGPNTCAPPGGCFIGVCDEVNNTCTSAPGNDGAPCDDGNTCTTGTTCLNGACINGMPTNEGMACDDNSGCTSNTICIQGQCGGGQGPTVYFADDFKDNSKGWTLGTEWQIAPAQASVGFPVGNQDPGQDHTPTADNGIAGVVIGGYASTGLHGFYYLESPVFNTAGAAGQVILGFYRWLNSDYTPFMDNVIEVWNGSSWVVIWNSGPSPAIQDAAWTFISHDITAYKNAGMRVRFGFNITSGGVFTVSSWNIDDVLVASGACP